MRSGRAPWLLAALAWVLVVAVVGSVTYLVVDRAGRGIGDTSQTRPLAVAPVASASPSATRVLRPRTPTHTGSPTPSPRTSSTRAPVPSSAAPAPTAAPTSSATKAPAPRTASFSTRGGTVVATCVDGSVRLDSITVRDGWRFEREAEHGYVEVKFDAEEADEIELKIGCRGGVPVQVDD